MGNLLYKSDLGDGNYKNPVLFADYSDPDVIRHENTYIMTASSFNHTPGLPILVSTDMVNWKLVNYAVENVGEGFENPRHSEGIWAPAIREHEGVFYIFYGMPDEGIFMIKTEDPLGKWSLPLNIFPGKGYIDPCPFWDEDGRAYVIHGYAKSRIGFNSKLGIFEMSNDGSKKISQDEILFDGTNPSHPAKTLEGPKIYKRDGFYFILAPAGGVRPGYQVALRSENIKGPYEIRTIMHTGGSGINGPHQGALVTDIAGDDWFIHFRDMGLYGRVTYLEPVSMRDGWIVTGIEKGIPGCGEPVAKYRKPASAERSEITYLSASDDFIDGKPSLSWQWMADHRDDFIDKDNKKGLVLNALNLNGSADPLLWECPNILAEKLVCPEFTFETKVDLSCLCENDRAGIIMTGGCYAALEAIKTKDGISIRRILSFNTEDGNVNEAREIIDDFSEKEMSASNGKIVFKMRFVKPFMAETPVLTMTYSVNEKMKDSGILFTPEDHTWVGAKTGIYAISRKNAKGGSAKFEYVKVENEEAINESGN